MKLTTRVARTFAIGALTLTLGASLAAAQDALTPTAEPSFGSVPLSDNIQIDPYIVTLLSGGSIDASTLNLGDACVGYIAPAPDYRVTWEGTTSPLRFYFASDGDTTMVVMGPDSQAICNDDGFGLDPMIEITNPAAGDYNVWVGSYEEDEFAPGYLMISKQATGVNGSPIESDLLAYAIGADALGQQTATPGSLIPDVEPTFGDVALAPGFTPDPYIVEILAGGEVNVSMLSLGAGCVGFVAAEPDVTLNLSGALPQLTIGFTAGDGIDTTLVVRGPSGEYLCNDDSNGIDPEILLSNAAAGEYDIWVGTYLNDFSDGDLYISQSGSVPANNNVVPTAAPNNGTTPVTGATTVPPVAIPSATPVAPPANTTPEVTGSK